MTNTSDVHCIVCGVGSKQGGVVRLNPPGEEGLWACFNHRHLFPRMSSTERVIERAMAIKAKIGENKNGT